MNLVRQFDIDDFSSLTFQEKMTLKLYTGKKDMTGDHLWWKFEEWRKGIRTKYTPKLPTNISSIPSCHQLRDVYKEFAIDSYKLEICIMFNESYFAFSVLANNVCPISPE